MDRDLSYIQHMLDTTERVVGKVLGLSREQFDADENLQLALTHLIQVLGEAARLVSDDFRGKHPEIPWRQIVGMRHRLVHDYMNVDIDVVWAVSAGDLPPLAAALRSIVDTADPE